MVYFFIIESIYTYYILSINEILFKQLSGSSNFFISKKNLKFSQDFSPMKILIKNYFRFWKKLAGRKKTKMKC